MCVEGGTDGDVCVVLCVEDGTMITLSMLCVEDGTVITLCVCCVLRTGR